MKNIIQATIIIGIIVVLNSCKKMLDVATPQNQLTTDKVFADTTSALSAMANAYALFNNTVDPNYNIYLSCYSDELRYVGSTQQVLEYVQSAVTPSNTTNANYWKTSYFAIYSCNSIIENVQKSANIPTSIKDQFTCEAKFLRALTYFYLINTYGSVPLTLTTDVNVNSDAARSDSSTVYRQIIKDLKDAQSGLQVNYIGVGRVRANKYAAAAFLAKVYLWQGDYLNAETAATSVLESGLYTPLPTLGTTFFANSKETILAFWTQFGYITNGSGLVPSSGAPQYFFTPAQLNAFEAGDLRKSSWVLTSVVGAVTYYSPYKYHNRTTNTTIPEYLIALRAGEQYLIRAESRARQNNLVGAVSDLNVVRKRAGLNEYAGATDKTSVLAAILKERRVELFSEWGNRYLDLKRTGNLNTVIGPLKSTWKSTATILPVPQYELSTNPSLIQSPGY